MFKQYKSVQILTYEILLSKQSDRPNDKVNDTNPYIIDLWLILFILRPADQETHEFHFVHFKKVFPLTSITDFSSRSDGLPNITVLPEEKKTAQAATAALVFPHGSLGVNEF